MRRKTAIIRLRARVLLALFAAMLAAMTTHNHVAMSHDADCAACVQHQRHAAHITQGHGDLASCPLCQLCGAVYDCPAIASITLYSQAALAAPTPACPAVRITAVRLSPSRAPPTAAFFPL